MAELTLPVPPTNEQRRIVAKLDRLFARTSRARAELGHIPQLIERYKQAILRKAFSGELTADWRAQAGQKETGRIATEISDPFTLRLEAPDSWQQWKFSDVCNIIGGSQPPKSNFTYCDGPGKVRLIQIRDYKTDDYVTFIPREMARRFCSKDDIMIGRYGPPIFQILHGLEGAYNVALMKAVPVEDRISKDYLYWYLHHPDLFNYVEVDSKRTSGQDGVNKRHLQRWPVLLPSLEEQGEIVLHIEKAMKWVDSLSSELGCALDLVDHLNEACLNRAFKGQLVTQDPNDEPASELLDRIRAERAARSNNGRNHRRK
jgi:type I restriction enzyme S subunit